MPSPLLNPPPPHAPNLQAIKGEMDRVNLEVQQAERDYDLNRCVCVWGGG